MFAAPFDAADRAAAAPRRFEATRSSLLTRVNAEMTACPDDTRKIRAPADPDATGEGPMYDLNLFNGCSAYPAVRGAGRHNPSHRGRQFRATGSGDRTAALHFEEVLPAGVGDAALCLQFTAEVAAPGYVVEQVQLLEATSMRECRRRRLQSLSMV